MYVLHIGDRNYSSWSLRGWMLTAGFGLAVETRLHPMDHPDFAAYAQAEAPARTVPMLEWTEGGERFRVWDSMAIAETVAERHPEAGLWPETPQARVAARCLAAEMHAGFSALRAAAPMNVRRKGAPLSPTPAVAADLARLETIWGWARGRFGAGGPYLFGAGFCAADAFFVPIAHRVRPYALPVSDAARAYVDALAAHPAARAWEAAARAETRALPDTDRI
jgi:glutathione S-transferase